MILFILNLIFLQDENKKEFFKIDKISSKIIKFLQKSINESPSHGKTNELYYISDLQSKIVIFLKSLSETEYGLELIWNNFNSLEYLRIFFLIFSV
jgi:DNA-dependent RNA polymerase auxiliary subunit epsilon